MTGKVHILTARPHRLLMPLFAILGDHIARGEQAILLVPEQLTLEMERKLLQTLQLQGFFDVDVLSPSRLYERVLDFARKINCDSVTLNVWCGNDSAMRFYEKCGMKPQKIGMETILC